MNLVHGSGSRLPAVVVVLFLLCLSCGPEPPSPPSDPGAIVTTMLESSARAWNAGDLEGFIDDYADDSMTTFMADGHAQYGFDWIRSNYARQFGPEAARDSLRFEEFAARALGPDHILATARYILYRGDSTTSSGPFTLVFEHRRGEWRIIHDHTNADAR
jgi:uncharacterized protein (TIGR02246 family)